MNRTRDKQITILITFMHNAFYNKHNIAIVKCNEKSSMWEA